MADHVFAAENVSLPRTALKKDRQRGKMEPLFPRPQVGRRRELADVEFSLHEPVMPLSGATGKFMDDF
ncbi:MAG TPA: hypothetical protein VGH50_08870 [Candidatus Binatia bacterium]